MKKNNDKGFLLVETLVVATFCLTVLVILFLQFKALVINYNNSYKYNTVEGIYNLNTIKRYLKQNNLDVAPPDYYVEITATDLNNETICTENFNIPETNNYCNNLIKSGNFKTIIYSNSSIEDLKNNMTSLSPGLQNFIKQLKNDTNNKRLIAEFNDSTFASIAYTA